jgi:anti-sigma factor RsiW
MERDTVHALTAAYALDALDDVEEREYEEHLRGCEQCRAELAAFSEAATSLAYAVDGPAPSAGLRDRILETARAERANVVPLRPRRAVSYALGGLAAAAAVVAIGLGLWANSLSDDLDRTTAISDIVFDPNARSVPLEGARGRLIVSPTGEAVLAVSGLEEAPSGKTYEIWVAGDGAPLPAGVFDGENARDVVRVREPVRPGMSVLVTIEQAGGVDAPTSAPLLSARA